MKNIVISIKGTKKAIFRFPQPPITHWTSSGGVSGNNRALSWAGPGGPGEWGTTPTKAHLRYSNVCSRET